MYVHREAQKGPAWIEQTCHELGWLAGWLAGRLRPREHRRTPGLQLPGVYCLVLLSSNFGPRGTLGLQLSGIVWSFCLAISGLEGHWGSSCRVHIAWSFCLATSVPKENWGSSCRLCSVLFLLCREAQRDPERPREAQRGPERPREAQRGPERPREAQRASEKHRRTETHKSLRQNRKLSRHRRCTEK